MRLQMDYELTCHSCLLERIKAISKLQQRYPAVTLKWSITKKFIHWLKGHDFTVWTDNNPLTHILTKPKLDAYEQRWVSKLSSYTFDLKCILGSKNIVANALSHDPITSSRMPC